MCFIIYNSSSKEKLKGETEGRVELGEYEDEPEITIVRSRRDGGKPVRGNPPGTSGKKFRPGRVMRRPERYYSFLKRQIDQRKYVRNKRYLFMESK